MHTGICKGCGRKLRSAKSIQLNYAPSCFKKAQEEARELQANLQRQMPGVEVTAVEPMARYMVSNQLVKQIVLLGRFDAYEKRFPGTLEVLEYPDHFRYQAENDPELHESADRTEDPEWFRRVKTALESAKQPAVIKILKTEGSIAI